MTNTTQTWLTQRDLAKRYQVHTVTIWRMVRRGDFPPPTELAPGINRWSPEVIAAHEASRPTPEYAGASK